MHCKLQTSLQQPHQLSDPPVPSASLPCRSNDNALVPWLTPLQKDISSAKDKIATKLQTPKKEHLFKIYDNTCSAAVLRSMHYNFVFCSVSRPGACEMPSGRGETGCVFDCVSLVPCCAPGNRFRGGVEDLTFALLSFLLFDQQFCLGRRHLSLPSAFIASRLAALGALTSASPETFGSDSRWARWRD